MLHATRVPAVGILALLLALCGCERRAPHPPKAMDQAQTKTAHQPSKTIEQAETKSASQPPKTMVQAEKGTAAASGRRDPTHLEEIVARWSRGNKDDAVAEFLLVDWQAPASFSKESAFGLTEQETMALSPSDQEARSAQYVSLKSLCLSVREAGKKAAAAGDRDKAKRHFVAVEQCGEFLAGIPNAPLILQQFAKAFVQMGSQEIDKLGRDTK
jgi:hypothetical protein